MAMKWGEVMVCDWMGMTESVAVTWAPWGPAAPQPEFRREKQSLTLSHWFSSLILFLLSKTVKESNWGTVMISSLPMLPSWYVLCSVCLFIVSSKAQYIVSCHYCDIFVFLFPARLLDCLLIYWHLGLFGKTDGNQCCVIMNKSAVSHSQIFPLSLHCLSLRMCSDTFRHVYSPCLTASISILWVSPGF